MRDAIMIVPGEVGQSRHPFRPVMMFSKRLKHVKPEEDPRDHQTQP